jgi:hypothetical protein
MIHVLKATGLREPFDEQKVLNSIRRAGIPHSLHELVLQHVRGKLYEDISTKEIYHHILEFLKNSEHPFSRSKYSLKEAIMSLGPTGYPFEDFIAKVLQTQGFATKVRQIMAGKCVSHEIDILAQKDNKTSMIEAKFHNSMSTRSEIHVALYTYARFLDIKEKNQIDDAWLVTNTKATIDAATYALCSGLKIVSWSFPEEGSLRDLIERSRLHPITILSSLSNAHKATLLNNHIVLCIDIHENPTLIDQLPLSKEEKAKILSEIAFICSKE